MPYTPHDWSPASWALLLTGMVLFVMSIASAYLLLVHRACQTTGAHLTDEEISPEFAPLTRRVPSQSVGATLDELTPAPL